MQFTFKPFPSSPRGFAGPTRLRGPIWTGVLIGLLSAPSSLSAGIEGFTEPYRTVVVSSAGQSALVKKVPVREGDEVQAGQLLAELDISVLKASLNIARKRASQTGKITASESEVAMSRRRFKKISELAKQGHATQAELDRAEAEFILTQANLVRALDEQELYKLERDRIVAQIEERRLTSPIDGVVTEIHRQVGEAIQINDPAVVTVVQLNPLRVHFSVNSAQAATMRRGQPLNIKMAATGETVAAPIETISPVMDAKSGTIRVTCILKNDDNAIHSGVRCSLSIAGSEPDSLFVDDEL